MKLFLKKILPPQFLAFYHFLLAVLANVVYRFPSRQLIVVGVTGTKGKSTVCNMIWQILTQAGFKTGVASTANFRIGDKQWLNDTKMTMQGRFGLQKLLRQMVKDGCRYAIVETSSEGIKQYRHRGVRYQVAVFTNLTPEHIEAHGNFDKYKKAKGKLFASLQGQKISILNSDDPYFDFFKNIPAAQYIYYGQGKRADLKVEQIKEKEKGFEFVVKGHYFYLPLFGRFNVMNALAAIAVAKSQNIPWADMQQGLRDFDFMPGRMEEIKTNLGFRVFVDYAHTPESLELVYKNLQPHARRLLAVLGSCGGGRDKAKRKTLGLLAAKYCQVVYITNEDPYNEDPQEIIDQVWQGLLSTPRLEKYKIIDRREAIAAALHSARPGDIVVITGKGSEQVLMTKQGAMPWDDRQVVRELIEKM